MTAGLEPTGGVAEDTDDPVIKPIFADIKTTLRAPVVGMAFRVLATEPQYLQQAWRQLRPNLLTVYFERQADEVRARAVRGIASLGGAPRPPAEASGVLRVFHYLNAKQFLAVGALRSATGGERPRLRLLPDEDKRQIITGIPDGAAAVDPVDPENTDEETGRLLAGIRAAGPGVQLSSDELALARWPEYFAWAWRSLRQGLGHPEYRRLQRELRLAAEEAILSLPFRMELSPHALRLCGLSETQIDHARITVDEFYRQPSGQVINTAFWSIGAQGEYDAARSPFPAALR